GCPLCLGKCQNWLGDKPVGRIGQPGSTHRRQRLHRNPTVAHFDCWEGPQDVGGTGLVRCQGTPASGLHCPILVCSRGLL
uniref:Thyroglobulin type-1 domain-containing protein n=1 Tax=Mesocestoides corti TaxID=53468 RepID=A0A5K3G3I4_MESCO